MSRLNKLIIVFTELARANCGGKKAGLGNILDMGIIYSETPLELFLLHICFEVEAAELM